MGVDMHPELAAGVTRRQGACCMRRGRELGSLEGGRSGAIAPLRSKGQLTCSVWVWTKQLGRERTQASRASRHGSESQGVHMSQAAQGTAGGSVPRAGVGGFLRAVY